MTDLVTIDGLVFDGEGGSDWVYQKLSGWYSSPPMRNDDDDRPNADGTFGSTRNHRGARALTFVGSFQADTFAEAESTLWDAFAAIQSDGVPFPLSVTTENGTRTCTVSLSGSAEVNEAADRRTAVVTAQFVASDPVKYGVARTVTTGLPMSGGGLEYELGEPAGALYYGALGDLGRVVLTNAGTAEVWPSFVVSGELTDGFFLQCLETGDVLRYERVVPAGTSVSLDARTGEVLVDGISDGSTYLVRDDWFSVPAGGSRTVQFNSIGASSGTPQLAATIADGYW